MNKEPYLIEVVEVHKYNPHYGDGRLCKCGHSYERHFDSYDNNASVGCKYCDCCSFEEKD